MAGVSVGTVSRFLNGQNTRHENSVRIENAIAKLNYRRNTIARAMRTERTQTVALLVPLFDEFHTTILSKLVEILSTQNYSVVTFNNAHQIDILIQAIDSIVARRIDGIVLSGTEEVRDAVNLIVARERPVVIFNNDIPGIELDRVMVNDRAATADAVTTMIAYGHERIGIVTGELRDSTGQNRLDGYLDALTCAGIARDAGLIVPGLWSRTAAYAATDLLLRRRPEPPTAIFYSSHVMALGGLECLKARGTLPGRDMDIVSFDDPDMFRFTTPPITAVVQPVDAIATSITDLMLSRLDGTEQSGARSVYLDCELKLRDSLTLQGSRTE